MLGLTRRQLEVLKYIQAYIAERGYSPSFREIMAATGIKSTSNMHRYIQALVARGHLQTSFGRARSLIPVVTEHRV